jgi:hypothetical protein
VKLHHFTASSTTRAMPPEKAARMGDEGKAVGYAPPTALLFEQSGLGCLSTVRRINAGNGWLDWQG